MLQRFVWRKLFVNIVATVVMLLVAGAALAGTGAVSSLSEAPAVDDVPASDLDDDAVDPTEGVVIQGSLLAPETATAGLSFGHVRSAEVRRFGQCMSAATSHEERAECRELKPRPAWQTPGHPGKGPDRSEGEDALPGAHGRAKAAEARGAAKAKGGEDRGKPSSDRFADESDLPEGDEEVAAGEDAGRGSVDGQGKVKGPKSEGHRGEGKARGRPDHAGKPGGGKGRG